MPAHDSRSSKPYFMVKAVNYCYRTDKQYSRSSLLPSYGPSFDLACRLARVAEQKKTICGCVTYILLLLLYHSTAAILTIWATYVRMI